jgi:outer membrane protein assembly factor BamE (lipoprotein component of BamABCDE complex)
MKRLRLIFFCIAFIACREKQDFSKIKAGMTGADVVKLMGRPDVRKPMIETEWWLYLDPEKHVVIIRDDTVVKCITQTEAIKVMEETLKNVDTLKHS